MDTKRLLTERYGSNAPTLPDLESPLGATVIESLLTHHSVRSFRPEPLPGGTLEWLIAAAQSAATSSNLQTWSVIAVRDSVRKSEAARLCGDQDFIRQAPLFLVFCADLARLTTLSEWAELPGAGLDYVEMFVMASIDATLAAQNAVVAAEALGLGICYVGGARNHPQELAALLQLPERVVALFGVAIGVPTLEDHAAVKPRLPQAEVLHHEVYSRESRTQSVEAYNATMDAFNAAQGRSTHTTWAQQAARRVATEEALTGREVLRQILIERGFALK